MNVERFLKVQCAVLIVSEHLAELLDEQKQLKSGKRDSAELKFWHEVMTTARLFNERLKKWHKAYTANLVGKDLAPEGATDEELAALAKEGKLIDDAERQMYEATDMVREYIHRLAKATPEQIGAANDFLQKLFDNQDGK
jgi:hypothetical protein